MVGAQIVPKVAGAAISGGQVDSKLRAGVGGGATVGHAVKAGDDVPGAATVGVKVEVGWVVTEGEARFEGLPMRVMAEAKTDVGDLVVGGVAMAEVKTGVEALAMRAKVEAKREVGYLARLGGMGKLKTEDGLAEKAAKEVVFVREVAAIEGVEEGRARAVKAETGHVFKSEAGPMGGTEVFPVFLPKAEVRILPATETEIDVASVPVAEVEAVSAHAVKSQTRYRYSLQCVGKNDAPVLKRRRCGESVVGGVDAGWIGELEEGDVAEDGLMIEVESGRVEEDYAGENYVGENYVGENYLGEDYVEEEDENAGIEEDEPEVVDIMSDGEEMPVVAPVKQRNGGHQRPPTDFEVEAVIDGLSARDLLSKLSLALAEAVRCELALTSATPSAPLPTRLIASPGPFPRTVRDASGKILGIPTAWSLLKPGDQAATLRVKKGPHWAVFNRRGRKHFSAGVWAPAEVIAAVAADLVVERASPAYQARLDRRSRVQDAYVGEFSGAVVQYLSFSTRHADIAHKLAAAVADHSTPVGSRTVARTKRISTAARAAKAVIAWMRHQATAYEGIQVAKGKNERRKLRKQMARESIDILTKYRAGENVDRVNCPLARALGLGGEAAGEANVGGEAMSNLGS